MVSGFGRPSGGIEQEIASRTLQLTLTDRSLDVAFERTDGGRCALSQDLTAAYYVISR